MPKISNQLFLNSNLDYNNPVKKNDTTKLSIDNNLASASPSPNKNTAQWHRCYSDKKENIAKESGGTPEITRKSLHEFIPIDEKSPYDAENNYGTMHPRSKFLAAYPSIFSCKTNILLGASLLIGSATVGALAFRHYAEGASDTHMASPSNILINNFAGKHFHPATREEIEPFTPSMHDIVRKPHEPYQYYSDIRETDPYSLFDNNQRIISFLKKNELISNDTEGMIKKENLLPAVAKYIYNMNVTLSQQPYRESMIVKNIVREESDLSTEQKHYMETQSDQDIIGKWLFHDVYGMSPGQFIANKIKSNHELTNSTIGDINNMLSFSQLLANNLLSYYLIPSEQWGEFNLMWYKYLAFEIPMLRWDETDMNPIPLKSHEFADLFTGAMLLDNKGYLRTHQLEDLMKIGRKHWDKAIKHGVDANKIDLYTVPSFIVLASNAKEFMNVRNSSAEVCLTVIDQYLAYRKETTAH